MAENNKPENDLAVVLLSGGLDSCVTMAIAMQTHKIALLHVGYSQRTQTREYNSFRSISRYYKIPESKTLAVELDYLKKIGGSSLTDHNLPINKDNKNIDIPNTYVPFRNTHLLSIAVSWAEVINAGTIYIGAIQQDNPDYPDCRAEYYDAFNGLVEVGTKPTTNIKVVTPLLNMSKAEIVKKGYELTAPLQLTWSCYERNDKACGHCQSCLIRLKAFKDAGFKDKIQYV
ncbi:MAG: 7-cyano-7-deazaguanine synthase QueC [Planctomycetota bacterium]|jgi:7-cyano-7-deazaguanine synthase